MRAVLQRVDSGKVTVDGHTVGEIGPGWLVLLGVGKEDDSQDVLYLAEKILGLRAFPDDAGKMNRSVVEAGGALLVVSQFTLQADCRKGKRPSFTQAAEPAKAEALYLEFTAIVRQHGIKVETGKFGAPMRVQLLNDGPVTFILDSKKLL